MVVLVLIPANYAHLFLCCADEPGGAGISLVNKPTERLLERSLGCCQLL